MDVILSWSGNQSRKVAEAMDGWLKDTLPGVKVWGTPEDIVMGSSWFTSLLGRVEVARLCIICVTPENVRSPWLYFGVGAVAGRSGHVRVCPYLLNIDGMYVANGPLAQFQWAAADKGDTWKLLRDINKHLQSGAYHEASLAVAFDKTWPTLKRTLDAIRSEHKDVPVQEVPESEALRAIYQLGREAMGLLVEAANDPRGMVYFLRTFEGTFIQVNGKQIGNPSDARSVAIWQGAIRQLLHQGLLENRGTKGEAFSVTAEGYRVADEIRSKGMGRVAEKSGD
jgi:hypothetical protein